MIWGPVTDVIGRKKAMMFVPLMNGTRAIVYLINSYFVSAHPKYLLFGSFLSCFYGELQGVIALCYAYMADVTVAHLNQRTMRMAVLETCLILSGIPAAIPVFIWIYTTTNRICSCVYFDVMYRCDNVVLCNTFLAKLCKIGCIQ